MVGLNYKDEDAAARAWLTQLGNPYEVIAVDHEGRAAIDWGVYGAPETFLVNPAGIIVHKVVGQVTAENWRTQFLPLIEGSCQVSRVSKRGAALVVAAAGAHAARWPSIRRRRCPIRCSRRATPTLIHELRCLQCQGETVADTPALFAVDIRRQVREMVAAGSTDKEVRQYMVDRYGEIILLRPQWSLANAWLWLAPGLFLLGGILIAWRVLRQRRGLLATDMIRCRCDDDG